MEQPVIDPAKVQTLIAGGLGAFLSVLFQRNSDKLTIFTTLVSAEVVSYFFAHPIWAVLHDRMTWVDDQWQGPVALTIGLFAIFIVGGGIKMAAEFWAEPWKMAAKFVVSIIERVIPGKRGE